MKRSGYRTFISTLIAAAMISVITVSAGAVDYSAEGAPDTAAPVSPSVLTDTDIADALEDAQANGADEAVVPMNEDSSGNALIQESAIAGIAGGGVPVTVEVTDQDGHDYSVTIDPAAIKEAKAINIAMDIDITDEDTDIAGSLSVPAGAVVIKPMQKGDFGMTLKITLSPADTAGIDPDMAQLFYVGDDDTVTMLPDGSVIVNDDGSLSILISHASEYVITDTDILAPDFAEDDVTGNEEGTDNETGDSEDIVTADDADDVNPSTGAALATGAAAAAAVIVLTAAKKKRK